MNQSVAFCFDLDGTITAQEILPFLAAEIDLYEEMMALTQATMNGVIPFEQSFKLRVRLLSEIPISRVQNIISQIPLQQTLTRFISRHQDNCFIVTGNLDVWIEKIASQLGCRFFCANADYVGDKLIGVRQIMRKGTAIQELRKNFSKIIAVGDGMNDVPMFEQSDIAIAYGAVHPPVDTLIKLANFVTYHERGLCNLLNTLL